MTNNKKLNILITIYLIFFISLITVLIFTNKIPCFIKYIFNIPCPFCGLTRAFKELFKLNIPKALYYNILSIPLLACFIYFWILLIKDIIKKDSNSINKLINIFNKYWILIVILIIVAWILNIIHGI
ncbi:MAG: DUF2752 domain-containing protein [Bacilli bacterium]|nr:DUF2752 domain-containing protein [Bacilli bacterium]